MPTAAEAGARMDVGRSLSLTARMVIGLVSLLAAVGVILAGAAFFYGRTAAQETYDRLLLGAANDIAASLSVIDGEVTVDLPVSAFELLALAPDDRIAYQVRGPSGRIVTGYAGLPAPPAARAGGDVTFYDATFTGEAARYVRVTRRFAERSLSGRVEIVVGQTLLARTQLALTITRNALVGLALGGVAVILLAVLVIRSALRPLETLAANLAARDPQDLTPIDATVPADMGVAVDAINGFMRRLDRQFDAMRGLISDTAHQLRTPVAALRAQADLAAREREPGQRERLIGRIHGRSVALGRLLDQLLSRALVTHRADSARREPVDLRDIALDLAESGDPQLIAPGVELRIEIGDEPVAVMGDALSLGEAARNLMNNALMHGKSPVTVGTALEAGTARLWVQDSGPGPAPDLRARMGSRFSVEGGGGSGLGLAIAAAVAEAYGGRLTLDDPEEGFRIAIVLPEGRQP